MTDPNFVGTIWTTQVWPRSSNIQGTKVIFRDGGKGSAYLVQNGYDKEYQVTWSVDAYNLNLSWSMAKFLSRGNTWYPLDFVNYWPLNYTTGPVVFQLGTANVPVSGGTVFNFTQQQVFHYP